ncbi:glycoside hydrolase family 2 protein [Pontiella agarivorans]|uniref:beta-galactosidase n=1 Tax=Pontiella agarivorans TaxID=3038953 RepID=A0ABU5N257_9BACT|nr:glycoside hydrolase family 2 TIM barrel-domain containing protein [Pontiella agarivorans]MDZ8120517.1 glycoside hydrolase family 2 TIM barrel-domain containing protein [Pontiella agarivorans]
MKKVLVVLGAWIAWGASAQHAERVYLSGKGPSDAVEWDFFCSEGRKSGEWTKIPVPSNWEQQGFGGYAYGHDTPKGEHDETGTYRTTFLVPKAWKDKHVRIVFEGAMNETSVKVNGKVAGAPNEGGYLPFRYNLDENELKYGEVNELEVLVKKRPENVSLDRAERKGDYWVFGGIYRPVYLEVLPKMFIDRVAIDAQADGTFRMDVFPQIYDYGKLRKGHLMEQVDEVVARIQTLDGEPVGEMMSARMYGGAGMVRLEGRVNNPNLWSPEFPNLYAVKVSLRKEGRVLFEKTERFGFRTFELRPEDGLYLNGKKIRIQGVNRNVFDPQTARAVNKEDVWNEARAIKAMNVNMVRSHMPATTEFMNACDELGLFVIVELCTWSTPVIDTPIARNLVFELVAKYQNHPSVLFWANGNEGGFNLEVGGLYHLLDIQRRPVLHPWLHNEALDTMHYPAYKQLVERLRGPRVYMPTEFMHGLYDGGMGAGLEDYWEAIRKSAYGAGGILWCWKDAAIARTDRGGKLDTFGNRSADGVVGPNGEKEASYFTVREIWSPIQIPVETLPNDFSGTLPVENRYYDTSLNRCTLEWELVDYSGPYDAKASINVLEKGRLQGPNVEPGKTGAIKLPLPADWRNADALKLRAFGVNGVEVMQWTWPISTSQTERKTMAGVKPEPLKGKPFDIQMGETLWSFSPETGQLLNCTVGDHVVGPVSGPNLYAGISDQAFDFTFDWNATVVKQNDAIVIESKSRDGASSFRWTLAPGGLVQLDYSFAPIESPVIYCAVGFDLPEEEVQSKRWLGDGPFRIWGNRRKGPQYGLWENEYNDAITGVTWEYPEFKGIFSDVEWMRLSLKGGHSLLIKSPAPAEVGVLIPKNSEGPRGDRKHPTGPSNAMWDYPESGGLFLFHKLPPVGTKSKDISLLGPQSGLVKRSEQITGRVTFHSFE